MSATSSHSAEPRPRARDLGIVVGELPPGAHNAITDVPGVKVGHFTLVEGKSIRTGVTAIVPHGGDIFRQKVPAAFDCYNGFGKAFGTVQIQELGVIETPILLGGTLCVPRIADAVMEYVIRHDDTGQIASINPAVGETNDGFLSDGRARPIKTEHVIEAITKAAGGPVVEGTVGAGTGTRCFGWKGGIGTSSRQVKGDSHTWTVGVLVQSNFGGKLEILGKLIPSPRATGTDKGSCAIVIATDAPLDARQLQRLARRSFAGMARTGASFSHGSGDYAFAFSTAWVNRRDALSPLPDEALSPLFIAVADATQEAIYNSLLRAQTVKGHEGRTVEAIPLELVRKAVRAGK
ncbi:MAG: P1 family peptidase [Verrucomicrobiota bacterium]